MLPVFADAGLKSAYAVHDRTDLQTEQNTYQTSHRKNTYIKTKNPQQTHHQYAAAVDFLPLCYNIINASLVLSAEKREMHIALRVFLQILEQTCGIRACRIQVVIKRPVVDKQPQSVVTVAQL